MLSVAVVQLRLAVVPVQDPDSVDAEGAIVSAEAVPASDTLTILPLESVTRRLAVLVPLEVGANCTPISQPVSGATLTPVPTHVLFGPILKCAELAPVRVADATLNGPFPV